MNPPEPAIPAPLQNSDDALRTLASPLDRLAAFVLDGLIVGIVSGLATAPFQEKIQLEELLRHSERTEIWAMLTALVAFVVYVLYHAVTVSRFGATYGQRFVGIQVVDAWTGGLPTITESVTRAFARPFSIALVFPLLGIFSDLKRRALHDRIANTYVFNSSKNAVAAPTKSEQSAVRIAMGVLALGIFLLLAVAGYEITVGQIDHSVFGASRAGGSDGPATPGCEAVAGGLENWGELKNTTRLTVALSMFAAGQIGEECLDQEANTVGGNTAESDRYHLAKAFAHADEPELSDGYLEEVCHPAVVNDAGPLATTEACGLAEILNMINEGAHEQAWIAFGELLKSPEATEVTRIWAIREAEHQMKFDEELKLIEQLDENRTLADFLEIRESIALWGVDRHAEAKTLAAGILTHLEPTAAVELSQWFCQREIEDECPRENPRSCKWFGSRYGLDERTAKDAIAGLTYVRSRECSAGDHVDYGKLETQVQNPSVAQYVSALRLHAQSKGIESKRALLKIIQSSEVDQEIQQEAFAKLVDFVSTGREMKVLEARWKNSKEISWSWRSVGHHLFNRYRKLQSYSDAVRIGDVLLGHEPTNQNLRNGLVLSAYKNHDYKHAWSYLQMGAPTRKIASADKASVLQKAARAEDEQVELAAATRDLQVRFGGP